MKTKELADRLLIAEVQVNLLQQKLAQVTEDYVEAERDCGAAIDALTVAMERVRELEARVKEYETK